MTHTHPHTHTHTHPHPHLHPHPRTPQSRRWTGSSRLSKPTPWRHWRAPSRTPRASLASTLLNYAPQETCCVRPRLVRVRVGEELESKDTHTHTHTRARAHTHTHTHTRTLHTSGWSQIDDPREDLCFKYAHKHTYTRAHTHPLITHSPTPPPPMATHISNPLTNPYRSTIHVRTST